MSEAIEAMERAEKIEQSGHGGGHGNHGGSNKLIGLTMGLIGVLIALCAALVGGERNEMSRSMIEQTQATADATSASTKFRVVMISIEQLRAQATVSAQTRERFVRLYDDYSKERKITDAWAKSYQPLIDAHFEAAEGYEHAQLIAEIGIVFASLAVLMASRAAWLVSIVLAVGSIGMAGKTHFETAKHLGTVVVSIEHHVEEYKALRLTHVGDHADADAAKALDPDGTIRKILAKAADEAPAAAPKEAAAKEENHGEHH
ncbi:MAG: hypothetical protein JWN73_3926 [Betaproteobacteria bacterium]|nr:hypothetical protein [Betaproteobacteria bacterium]